MLTVFLAVWPHYRLSAAGAKCTTLYRGHQCGELRGPIKRRLCEPVPNRWRR